MSRSSTQAAQLERLVRLIPLVRVDHQHEARLPPPSRAARTRSASSTGPAPPTLNLQPASPGVAIALHLAGDLGERLPVVAADRDHLDAPPEPAPEPPQRLAERLADGVPDRRVDAGTGDEAEPPVAQDVERRGPGELPAALDLERVLADQPRLDLVPDDREDLVERCILVAGVRLADDALARVDARDHRGALRHAVVAAREHAGERHAKRHDLDALDRERIQARLADHAPRGLLEAHRTAAPRSLDSFPVMCSILSPSAISEKPRSWAANVTGQVLRAGREARPATVMRPRPPRARPRDRAPARRPGRVRSRAAHVAARSSPAHRGARRSARR